MTEVDVQDLLATFDCKIPNCQEPARTNRGTYAYLCDRHKGERRDELGIGGPSPSQTGDNGRGAPIRLVEADVGFEAKAKSLVKVGKQLDVALARYGPARETLDEAMQAWKDALEALADDRPRA